MTGLNANRTALIGLGGFGLHLVAHLVPRLEFADEQRQRQDPAAPRLRDLVSYAVVLPNWLTGEIELWSPHIPDQPGALSRIGNSQVKHSWAQLGVYHRQGDRRLNQHLAQHAHNPLNWEPVGQLSTLERLNLGLQLDLASAFHQTALASGPPEWRDGQRPSRQNLLDRSLSEFDTYAELLGRSLARARLDRLNFPEDHTQTAVFLVGALADDLASAMLLPTLAALREALGDSLVDLTGLFSIGSYTEGVQRPYALSCVLANLAELHALQYPDSPAGEALLKPPRLRRLAERPPFNHCYLLDRTKASGALASDEHEVVVSLGNFLEAAIASPAGPLVARTLEADQSNLRQEQAIFSSLGAATEFVPLSPLRDWVQDRLAADILSEHVLQPAGLSGPAAAREMEKRRTKAEQAGVAFARQRFETGPLLRRLTHKLPLRNTRGGLILLVYRLWGWLRRIGLAGWRWVARIWRGLRPQPQPPTLPGSTEAGIEAGEAPLPTTRDWFLPLPWYTPNTQEMRRLGWLPWLLIRGSQPGEWMRLADDLARVALGSERLDGWALEFALRAGLWERVPSVRVETPTTGIAPWPTDTPTPSPTPDAVPAEPPAAAEGTLTNPLPIVPVRFGRLAGLTTNPTASITVRAVRRFDRQNNRRFRPSGGWYYRAEPEDEPEANPGQTVETEADDNRKGTLLDSLLRALEAQCVERIVTRNTGLIEAGAWLAGVERHLENERARLRQQMPSPEQAWLEDQEQRAAIDLGLAGRPNTVYGGRARTGLANRRPFGIALAARVVLTTAALSYLFLGLIFLRFPELLSAQQMAYVTLLSLALSTGLAVARLLLHHVADTYYRWREARRQRRYIDQLVNYELDQWAQRLLNQALATVRPLRRQVEACVAEVAQMSHQAVEQPQPQPDEFTDTPLRQAVYDERLLSAVWKPVKQDLREALERQPSLWLLLSSEAEVTAQQRKHELQALLQATRPAWNATALTPPEAEPDNALFRVLVQRLTELAAPYNAGQQALWLSQTDTAGLNIEALIVKRAAHDEQTQQRPPFSAHGYLADLGYRAKPYLKLLDHGSDRYVQHIDCLVADSAVPPETQFAAQTAPHLRGDGRWSSQEPSLQNMDDPFTLTYVQTVHGAPLGAIASLPALQYAFGRLNPLDLDQLRLMPIEYYQPLDGQPGSLRPDASEALPPIFRNNGNSESR